jgi:hypothetical protein
MTQTWVGAQAAEGWESSWLQAKVVRNADSRLHWQDTMRIRGNRGLDRRRGEVGRIGEVYDEGGREK